MTEYTEKIHRSGRIWFLIVYATIFLFPIGSSIYFNAWPDPKELLTAAIGVVPLYWAVGIVEAFTYMPILGAGGSYLGFITGNMSNLKVPVAINAMESMGVEQNTEEGDVISTIVIAVSSIVTVAVIIIFVLLTVPLTPIFTLPTLQPAFSNIVSSLFGALMIVYIAKSAKIGAPIVFVTAILFILIPKLGSIYPLILPFISAIAAVLARILYKKGKI